MVAKFNQLTSTDPKLSGKKFYGTHKEIDLFGRALS
jgi:hypothetical protein